MENSETQTELTPDAGPKRRRPFPRGVALFLLLAVLAAAAAAVPALRGGSGNPNASPAAPSPAPGPILAEAVFAQKLPEWFPGETWAVDFRSPEGPVYIVKFKDPQGSGKEIYYQDFPTGGSVLGINTEDAELRTDLQVHGYDALMSVKEGLILVWGDTDRDRLCDLELHGPHPGFTPELLLRMAESLYEAELPPSPATEAPAPLVLDAEPIFVQMLPEWFPGETWGMTFGGGQNESIYYLLDFEDLHGNRIAYSRVPAEGTILDINTENAEVRTDLRVRGNDALMSVKEGLLILVWSDTDRGVLCTLELQGQHPGFTPELLLRMAESLYPS